MVEWHHQFNRHEFKQAPGDGEGQGSLACCMQSMGSQKVKHDWVTEQQQIRYLTLFSKISAMYLQLFWVCNRCDHLQFFEYLMEVIIYNSWHSLGWPKFLCSNQYIFTEYHFQFSTYSWIQTRSWEW